MYDGCFDDFEIQGFLAVSVVTNEGIVHSYIQPINNGYIYQSNSYATLRELVNANSTVLTTPLEALTFILPTTQRPKLYIIYIPLLFFLFFFSVFSFQSLNKFYVFLCLRFYILKRGVDSQHLSKIWSNTFIIEPFNR